MNSNDLGVFELCSLYSAERGWEYCYLWIPEARYQEFKRAIGEGDVALEDYGQVLIRGDGRYPPPDVVRMLENTLAFDHGLETKLSAESFAGGADA